MVSSIYKKTFSVLMKRPFRLWGISLLCRVPVSGGLRRVHRRSGCRVLRCASAVGFHVDDLPQQLPHGTGAEDGLSVRLIQKGSDPSRSGRHGMDAALDLSCGRSFRSSGSCSASSVCMNTALCPTFL